MDLALCIYDEIRRWCSRYSFHPSILPSFHPSILPSFQSSFTLDIFSAGASPCFARQKSWRRRRKNLKKRLNPPKQRCPGSAMQLTGQQSPEGSAWIVLHLVEKKILWAKCPPPELFTSPVFEDSEIHGTHKEQILIRCNLDWMTLHAVWMDTQSLFDIVSVFL